MGVEEYEPRVIHQFLELWYRYAVDVLTDAQVHLELARNRNEVPLPKAIPEPGIPLPPKQDTLISTNYQFAIPKKQPAQAMEETGDEFVAKAEDRCATPNISKSIVSSH
ncbi:Transcription initiation factor TFIID subunit 9 [Hibiscus syriacus]|uniref:Transcription initiation factor TFIID subunit 9 n=1 Tax=Hibiscus syriacus TaxID=106335 RepID=A0A6A2YDY2_HIBSY|nr:Transcription initiation factor TFIID subunit 9 [Hibiscus syriacus]